MKRIIAKLGVGVLITAIGMMTNLGAESNLPDWKIVEAIAEGAQVRITAGSRQLQGTLTQTTEDVLVLTSGAGQETFERQQVSVVSVRKVSHRKRNALVGLSLGTGVGAGIGAAGGGYIVSKGQAAAAVGALGALAGTVAGALIPSGGWSEVYRVR